MGSLWWKVESNARVISTLGLLAGDEERLPGGLEGAVERSEEVEGAVGEELSLGVLGSLGVDLDAVDHCV